MKRRRRSCGFGFLLEDFKLNKLDHSYSDLINLNTLAEYFLSCKIRAPADVAEVWIFIRPCLSLLCQACNNDVVVVHNIKTHADRYPSLNDAFVEEAHPFPWLNVAQHSIILVVKFRRPLWIIQRLHGTSMHNDYSYKRFDSRVKLYASCTMHGGWLLARMLRVCPLTVSRFVSKRF